MLELRRLDHLTDHGYIDDSSDLSERLDEQRTTTKLALTFLEKKNLVFLCTIYFIHAIPLTFSWYTMPIILRQQLSYSAVGTFLVSQYPYSWKAVWSPLVDGLHHPLIGRRKTCTQPFPLFPIFLSPC